MPGSRRSGAAAQAAAAVLMVRPASFGWNPQTQPSNRFQRDDPALAGDASARARAEFDALVAAAARRGRRRARRSPIAPMPVCPDAIFPEQLGEPARRRHRRAVPDAGAATAGCERRLELIAALARARRAIASSACSTSRTTSCTAGSSRAPAASCSITSRASPTRACRRAPIRELLDELCDELGYEPVRVRCRPTRRACRSITPT